MWRVSTCREEWGCTNAMYTASTAIIIALLVDIPHKALPGYGFSLGTLVGHDIRRPVAHFHRVIPCMFLYPAYTGTRNSVIPSKRGRRRAKWVIFVDCIFAMTCRLGREVLILFLLPPADALYAHNVKPWNLILTVVNASIKTQRGGGGGGVDKRSETNSIEFKGNYLIIPFLLVTDNGDSFIEATENSFVGIFIGCIRVA